MWVKSVCRTNAKGILGTFTVEPDILLMATLQTSVAKLVVDSQFEFSKIQPALASYNLQFESAGASC